MPKIDYDSIPVYYCDKCKSLMVLRVEGSKAAISCGICGSGHFIKKANINTLIENGTIKAVEAKGFRERLL